MVIAQLNPADAAHAGRQLHPRRPDRRTLVGGGRAAPDVAPPEPSTDEASGGSASTSRALVEDGSTIQLGIGAIPNAVLPLPCASSETSASTPRCSPMASSTWSRRGVDHRRPQDAASPGKIVSSASAWARRELYDFVDNNPGVRAPPDRLYQRHLDHPPQRPDGDDQLGDRGGPDRPGLRRLDRDAVLQRDRRADGADQPSPTRRSGSRLPATPASAWAAILTVTFGSRSGGPDAAGVSLVHPQHRREWPPWRRHRRGLGHARLQRRDGPGRRGCTASSAR